MRAARNANGVLELLTPRRTDREATSSNYTVWYVGYLTVIALAGIGSMTWAWFATVAPSGLGPHSGEAGLAFAFFLAWVLVVLGGLTLMLRAVGPIGFGRAVLTWCLGSPMLGALLHRRMLASRVLAAMTVAVAAGVAAILVVTPLTSSPVRVLGVLVAVVTGPALVSITIAEQAGTPSAHLALTQAAGTGLVLTGLLIWYLAAFGLITVGPAAALATSGALAGVVVAWGLAHLNRAREAASSGTIPLRELQRAGDVVDRVTASVTMLTTLPLQGAPRRRRPLHFTAPSLPTRVRPGWLAWVDTRRALARWPVLVVLILLVPLAGSVTQVAGHGWGCLTLTVLDFAVASRLAGWLMAWTTSPGLRFLVPFPDLVTRAALLATPIVGAAMFAAAAVGLAGLSPLWIAVSVLCAVLGVARRMRARDPSEDFALLVWTPDGPLPLNLGLRLAAGWDAAVLGALASRLSDATALRDVIIVALLYAAWTASTSRRRAHQR